VRKLKEDREILVFIRVHPRSSAANICFFALSRRARGKAYLADDERG
jgi:hypothetical protein